MATLFLGTTRVQREFRGLRGASRRARDRMAGHVWVESPHRSGGALPAHASRRWDRLGEFRSAVDHHVGKANTWLRRSGPMRSSPRETMPSHLSGGRPRSVPLPAPLRRWSDDYLTMSTTFSTQTGTWFPFGWAARGSICVGFCPGSQMGAKLGSACWLASGA